MTHGPREVASPFLGILASGSGVNGVSFATLWGFRVYVRGDGTELRWGLLGIGCGEGRDKFPPSCHASV